MEVPGRMEASSANCVCMYKSTAWPSLAGLLKCLVFISVSKIRWMWRKNTVERGQITSLFKRLYGFPSNNAIFRKSPLQKGRRES